MSEIATYRLSFAWFFGASDTAVDGAGRLRPQERVDLPASITEDTQESSDAQIDRRTLDDLRADNMAAFETVYRAHYQSAVKFATRFVPGDAAQDLAQEVFAGMWERRASLAFGESIRTYVLTSVRRRALNAMHHARVVARTATHLSEARDPPPGMGSAGASTDAAAEEAVLLAAFHRELDALPERQRSALVLRWEHGLTNREISHLLGIGEAAVSRLLARATQTLSALM